jgi:hypothetical protein
LATEARPPLDETPPAAMEGVNRGDPVPSEPSPSEPEAEALDDPHLTEETAGPTPEPASLRRAPAARKAASDAPAAGDGPTVLILGDSMVVTELGRDLGRTLERELAASVVRRGRSSTGLARPDFYDWFTEGARLAERVQPDVVVIIVGGNDGQDLVDEEGRGRIRWRSEGWPAAYADRVHRFLDGMSAPGRRFVWVELPAMAHRRLEGKLRLIRSVQREALAGRPDVVLQLDTAPCFYGEGGRLLADIPRGDKRGRPIRQEDGIHLSLFGARYVSRCIAPELLRGLASTAEGVQG